MPHVGQHVRLRRSGGVHEILAIIEPLTSREPVGVRGLKPFPLRCGEDQCGTLRRLVITAAWAAPVENFKAIGTGVTCVTATAGFRIVRTG